MFPMSSLYDDKKPNRAERLVRRAWDAAEASDRWLVSLASEIGNVARTDVRAMSEMLCQGLDKTIEATKLGLDKTIQATKRIIPSRRVNVAEPATASDGEVASSGGVPPVERGFSSTDAPSPNENRATAEKLDLLPATAELPNTSKSRRAARSPSSASYPAGVLPVVDALERVVGEHARSGGRSLDGDARFWKLIELLELLKRSQPPEGATSDPITARIGPK